MILNNNNTLTVGDDGTLKVKGTEFTGTYAEFLALADATSGKTLTTDGFYMANAPLANNMGGSATPATVTTLTDLTGKFTIQNLRHNLVLQQRFMLSVELLK